MAKAAGKIYVDPEIGEVVFRKSTRSRSIAIRVHPVRGVAVSVPYIVPYSVAMAFFQSRRGWVLETMARQKERIKDVVIPSEAEVESLRRKAKEELPPRLAELAARYGFKYNRVTIKHNTSNWGSCSTKGNINLNLNIVRLPKVLQDYVLLHELCHLRHHDHGHAFHLLLEHVLTDNIMNLMNSSASEAGGNVPRTQAASEAGEVASYAQTIARKAVASRAKYPLDYVMTREIKNY